MNIGLAIGQSNYFSVGLNSGIGIRTKDKPIDRACVPNLFTGANCSSQYYHLEREWFNQFNLQYNFSIKGLNTTKFSIGSGIIIYRSRVGLISEHEEEFHILYPNEITDSIIHWTISPTLQLGITQEIFPDCFRFILNLSVQTISKKYSKYFGNGLFIRKSNAKVGGIYHLQSGFEYSLSDRHRINLIWDVPLFFNSGYNSSKWIFMAGYRFCIINH